MISFFSNRKRGTVIFLLLVTFLGLEGCKKKKKQNQQSTQEIKKGTDTTTPPPPNAAPSLLTLINNLRAQTNLPSLTETGPGDSAAIEIGNSWKNSNLALNFNSNSNGVLLNLGVNVSQSTWDGAAGFSQPQDVFNNLQPDSFTGPYRSIGIAILQPGNVWSIVLY